MVDFDMAAILDAILNFTFLPHIWNVYPSFFHSPMGPLQIVKIRGHLIAHRIPISSRTIDLNEKIPASAQVRYLISEILNLTYEIFCTCCLWPWFGPPASDNQATLQMSWTRSGFHTIRRHGKSIASVRLFPLFRTD